MPRCDQCKFRQDQECHRFPPAVQKIGEPTHIPNVSTGTICGFPSVSDSDWCGEFIVAPPEDITASKMDRLEKDIKAFSARVAGATRAKFKEVLGPFATKPKKGKPDA